VLAIDPLQKNLDFATETGLLTKSGAARLAFVSHCMLMMRPCLLHQKKEEVETILKLLGLFGEASELLTNFHKSTVVPIRCQGIDLNVVLRNMPARRATFPLKYLGLPLSSSGLKKSDFQFLIDKISNKLSGWNGKNLSITTAGTVIFGGQTPPKISQLPPKLSYFRRQLAYFRRRLAAKKTWPKIRLNFRRPGPGRRK
jgi:hypothetical protein